MTSAPPQISPLESSYAEGPARRVMNVSRLRRACIIGATACAFLAAATSYAHRNPMFGWSPLGALHLRPNQCDRDPCTMQVDVPGRFPVFALSSDALFGIVLAGRLTITCDDDFQYHVFVNSPSRWGAFQYVRNTCTRFETKHAHLELTTASVRDEDKKRGVLLTLYGSNTH